MTYSELQENLVNIVSYVKREGDEADQLITDQDKYEVTAYIIRLLELLHLA
jgi:hypothetical protein